MKLNPCFFRIRIHNYLQIHISSQQARCNYTIHKWSVIDGITRVTDRAEYLMKKTSWAYNLAFTIIGELFGAVVQTCGGPQNSFGNAPEGRYEHMDGERPLV